MGLPGSIFNCRLCWRITLVVFGLILAIESIILIPSAWYFMESEQQRLARDARLLIDPVLAKIGNNGTDISSNLDTLIGQNGLLGVTIYDESGKLIASAGESVPPPANDINGSRTVSILTETDNNNLISMWSSQHRPDWSIVANMNTNHVSQRLHDYIFRVTGLVAIIVIVVTVGTMLILDITVLRPLLALRKSAISAGQNSDRSSVFALKCDRNDEIGELISAYNFMLEQVTESHRQNIELAEQQAKFLLRHDRTTDLPNQTALEEFLDQQIRLGKNIILLQLSFRQFRLLDSTYGKGTEDEVACAIAQRLQHAAVPGDFLAYLEGGRFIVSRSGKIRPSQATALVEYFLSIAQQPFKTNSVNELFFTVYAGITLSNHKSQSGRDLLAQTNMAVARIHENDHCKYAFYSTRHAKEALQQQTLLKNLEHAISQNELSIVLQPKMELQPQCGTTLAGAEVLIRWEHPERGHMSPAEFIPLAESSGLIGAVGDFVLFSAAQHIRYWLDRYSWSPRLAVNISAREFSRPDLITRMQKILEYYDIAGEYIELEITETTTMRDAKYTALVFASLRELGIQISIDDFGTGYSSLSYLKKLPVDALKIDKSFVEDIGINEDARMICEAIIHLGHTLGMRIIAEGVESKEQLDFLCQQKCNEAQGYLLGKPATTEAFEKTWFISKNNNKSRSRSIA